MKMNSARLFLVYFCGAMTSIVIPSLLKSKVGVEQAGLCYLALTLVGNLVAATIAVLKIRVERFVKFAIALLIGICVYLSMWSKELTVGFHGVIAIVSCISVSSIIVGTEHARAMSASRNWLTMRACGSAGFGVGAIAIHLSEDKASCLIFGAASLLPLLAGNKDRSIADTAKVDAVGKGFLSKQLIVLGLIAVFLKLAAVPWDGWGVMFLENERAMGWLAAMVACEVVLLFASEKFLRGRESIAIGVSSLAWCASYNALWSADQSQEPAAAICLAMIGISFNCQGLTHVLALAGRAVSASERTRTQVLLLAVHNLASAALLPMLLASARMTSDWSMRWQWAQIIAVFSSAILLMALPFTRERQKP